MDDLCCISFSLGQSRTELFKEEGHIGQNKNLYTKIYNLECLTMRKLLGGMAKMK